MLSKTANHNHTIHPIVIRKIPPFLSWPKRPWSENLPSPPHTNPSANIVLAVAAGVAILIYVPALALTRASVWVPRCNFQGALRFFPFSLTFSLKLHFPFEERLRGP